MPESDNLNTITLGPTGTSGGPGDAGLPEHKIYTDRTVMLARLGYAAYGATTNYKNFQGNPMPAFDHLPATQLTAWRAAADALDQYLSTERSPELQASQSQPVGMAEVIVGVQRGLLAARKGWNGKGMFLYYVPAASYAAQTNVAKQTFGDTVPYGAYMAMKTADGNVVPWLCSQTDMFATDWHLFI